MNKEETNNTLKQKLQKQYKLKQLIKSKDTTKEQKPEDYLIHPPYHIFNYIIECL